MKTILAVIIILSATGCSTKTEVNQCLVVVLFNNCMQQLPEGPESTHYNDWDEVVRTCSITALQQSKRRSVYVPNECKAGW